MKNNLRRSTMVLTALLVLMSLFAVPTNAQAVGAIYYVDCATGNDSNNGLSPSTAWRTTTRANQQTYTAGDQILFARGTVCSGAAFKPVGNGGFFKTKEVGQTIMAAAMNVPVSVMETAGEGGAWGIALLASYMLHKAESEPLEDYLSNKVFAGENGTTVAPDQRDVAGFAVFMERYKKGLVIERAAVDGLR